MFKKKFLTSLIILFFIGLTLNQFIAMNILNVSATTYADINYESYFESFESDVPQNGWTFTH
ncbi:MAG: hypothetical protein JXA54_13060 [Candidatus Heimdallarchaeota archaeon]|nr:hypothetical protein [Candidatus Heimdallarchaeota archaeon]